MPLSIYIVPKFAIPASCQTVICCSRKITIKIFFYFILFYIKSIFYFLKHYILFIVFLQFNNVFIGHVVFIHLVCK